MTTVFSILAASAMGYLVYILSDLFLIRLTNNPLTDFLGQGANQSGFADQTGARLLGKLPFSMTAWENHLHWSQRGGLYPGDTLGRQAFMALCFAVVGLFVPLTFSAPAAWLVPLIAGVMPFLRLRSQAEKVRRRTTRQVPELAALVAAELSAETPMEDALERAAELPGPLARILMEAIAESQTSNRPLLTPPGQGGVGTLKLVFAQTRLPALRAFSVQLDLVARTGIEGAARMQEISVTLASEYRQRLREETAKLETRLSSLVGIFYFIPLFAILTIATFGAFMRSF